MPKRSVGEIFKRGRFYSVRFYDGRGRRRTESSKSETREDAERLLRKRLQAKDDGIPVDSQIGKVKFEGAADDLLNDYRVNGKKSFDEAERRIEKHLAPFFGKRKLSSITTTEVRAYVAKRQADTTTVRKAYDLKRKDGTVRHVPEQRRTITGVSNAEINRELTTLKRIFSLAIQAGKLLHKPHIPLLRESNVRTGFFELDQFNNVLKHLPEPIRPVATFAYITGWRITSEVLPLEWRHVDLKAGEVRLDPGTTKNREGRVFKLTDDLRTLLEERKREADGLKRDKGQIVRRVFFRMIADKRGGEKHPRPIRAFMKAWKNACAAAGCPGRIPHDLRRTAVRNMVRAGVPERVAMKLTGHKTRSVFERYNIVSDGDLDAAAVRLSGLMGSKTGSVAGSPADSVNRPSDVTQHKTAS